MNKSSWVRIDENEVMELSRDLFLREAGLDREGKKQDNMRKAAFDILEECRDRINNRAAYSYYKDFELDGTVLRIDGESIECRAFDRIRPETVKGVYVYAVCSGDFYLEDRPVLDQLYADIWGTSFCDATRRILLDELRRKSRLSDSFGPGFYGMSPDEMIKMEKLVDFRSMDMIVRPSGVIWPLKSCSGLYFDVTEQYETLAEECKFCFGQAKTCRLCGINREFSNCIK